METLQDKVAVITGAASGIGRAAAWSLVRRGARVVIADIDADGAERVAGEIAAAGGSALAVPCDVAAEGAFEELRRSALDGFGRVDVVMNNAGVLTRGLPEHIPVAEWQRVLDINLMSVVRSNSAFLPLLVEQGSGHLVNTASFAGLFTYSYDRLPYAASKAALIQLSEGLALYLRPQGIGVTVLCPGPVVTGIAGSIRSFGPETTTCGPGPEFEALQPEQVGEQVAEAILANRFMLQTDDNVRPHLRSRAADWDAYLEDRIAALQD
ncbi:SDR family NAD(P)-dependent oxidoreductase [Saccharopolyspora sp. NFXS83]|uniref:SDR family oxidoreductase n=1 Tax=Saccharopolyspora sp. NFXS83 TaxID=2993560 RepID=UPI00224AD561|nr:SDR family oxidoreductase [Saccharopolyspora sp. NFXS83]MCX2730148.1 SDR family NAD(P)-dependent oxidoreductase [Saccharopolyspora sp. NFXS83]